MTSIMEAKNYIQLDTI